MQSIASLGLLLLILGLCGGSVNFWSYSSTPLIPAGSYLVAIGALTALIAGALVLRRKGTLDPAALIDLRVWSAGLILVFFSDWLTRPWGFLQGPSIRGELLLGIAASFLLLQRGRWRMLRFLPIASALLLIWSFFLIADGRLLFSDDHAMFFFRIELLKARFPSIPFWSPLWNAGLDARDFFATGALNAFLIAAPLIYAFDLENVYNIVVAFLLWVLLPGCTFIAVRLLNGDRFVAAIAAALSMTTSLVWYRWALKYGTMGFVTSSALLPLVLALGIRFIVKPTLTWKEIAASVIVFTLMLLWSPAGLAISPLFLVAIPYSLRIIRNPRKVITLLLMVAINLPWLAMFVKVSAVGSFVQAHKSETVVTGNLSTEDPTKAHREAELSPPETPSTTSLASIGSAKETHKVARPSFRHKARGLSLRRAISSLQEKALSMSPLVVLFSIPGLFLLTGIVRITYAALGVWLLGAGTLGVSLYPQLELDRMLVMAAILMSFPIALAIKRLFDNSSHDILSKIAAAVPCAYLIVAPFSATGIVLNRSLDKYTFMDKSVLDLTSIIRENSSGGRALFSGCVLHQLSGGHLAPLAMWADTPLVASSYAHNIWRYTQIIPKSYLARGEEGVQEFFDHMNATIVLAHEPYWKKHFQSRPDLYEELGHGGAFIAFRRVGYQSDYFLEGSGEFVDESWHSITVRPESDRIVLKFKHYPFLRSSGCKLTAREIAPEHSFVELTECVPGEPVVIDSINPLDRLLLPGAGR